jgi:hypothetical protein
MGENKRSDLGMTLSGRCKSGLAARIEGLISKDKQAIIISSTNIDPEHHQFLEDSSLPTPNSWQGRENRSFHWCCPKLGIPKLAILFGKVSDDKLSTFWGSYSQTKPYLSYLFIQSTVFTNCQPLCHVARKNESDFFGKHWQGHRA